jgi:hypothetical protein
MRNFIGAAMGRCVSQKRDGVHTMEQSRGKGGNLRIAIWGNYPASEEDMYCYAEKVKHYPKLMEEKSPDHAQNLNSGEVVQNTASACPQNSLLISAVNFFQRPHREFGVQSLSAWGQSPAKRCRKSGYSRSVNDHQIQPGGSAIYASLLSSRKAATTPMWLLVLLLLALLIPWQLVQAGETPVNLGSAANFSVLAGSTVTSIGATIVNGNLGLWPGTAVSGYPPGVVTGNKEINNPTAQTAQGDLTTAFIEAAGRATAPITVAGNLGGQTLPPGLYKSGSSLEVSAGILTLDGQGDPNAVFIFQIASTFTVTSGQQIVLIGEAKAANVFWQVGTSATIGTTAIMVGNILADQSISLATDATLEGRALARIGAVTLQGNIITVPPLVVAAPEIAVEQPVGQNIADGGLKDFGPVAIGLNADLVFTIKNTGIADITGLGITLDGADAALFSVTATANAPVSGPNGSTTFTVRFAPLSAGLKTAVLHIANNDADENPFDIFLNGTGGAAPEIAVEQPLNTNILDGGSRNFGMVAAGFNADLVFTIKNIGTADLTDLSITIDGLDATQFAVTTAAVAPVSGPLGSTTFTIRFSPASAGLKTAALHIANNDSNENPFDIIVTGNGVVGPEIAVEQPAGVNIADGGSKSFGPVAAGSTADLVFTIKNTGTADLTGLGITIDGADALLFTVTASATAPVSGPLGSTTFTVRFAPLVSGVKTAVLHIASNDADENPFDIVLTGGTAGPLITAAVTSPILLNPQTGLYEQTVRLTNTGLVAVDGVQMLIQGLPIDVIVYNASGNLGGTPYLQSVLPLAAGAFVDFLIEYRRDSRVPIPQPIFVAQAVTPDVRDATGPVIVVDRSLQLVSGRYLIEFSAVPGTTYFVQYSSDLITWKTAVPSITAVVNRVQWYDDGPPKTESLPAGLGSRFYRVRVQNPPEIVLPAQE